MVKAVDSLRKTLELLKHILADEGLNRDTRDRVDECVRACLTGIEALERERKELKLSSPNKFKSTMHRVAYPFKKDTLDKVKKTVGELLGHLSLTVQLLGMREGSRHHSESLAAVGAVRQEIQSISGQSDTIRDSVEAVRKQHQAVSDATGAIHAETQGITDRLGQLQIDGRQPANDIRQLLTEAEAEKLRAILTWIKAPDVTSDHNVARRACYPGTGQWFLELAEYFLWKYGSTSCLWVNGKVGCCKTVLSSTIIEDLRAYCGHRWDRTLAYFYFTFSDQRKQSREELLRALVMQLSQGRPAVKSLRDTFAREYGRGLTEGQLEIALTEILEMLCGS
ncbi:hypothetical protein B0A55_02282 [Friedmanniomyces simplex]|uniref:Nephrocystin 3-like N-terminal domain-containing protein n=1 Tax=Friedmanniomyces simplex TaxID=329884 RepID=A0A4U0Y4S6_9PEZI|nr:hypothetical protein B0A55_02282 [Friedmanniomyces simplex]